MVRILSAVLIFAAASASATPAIPSFEFSAAQLQTTIAALRVSQIQAKAGSIGPQIGNLAWDLERYQRDTQRLRNDLSWIQQRLRRVTNQPGQPNDSSLRWDIQRFTHETEQLSRDTQWRLNDLRHLSAQAQKDETLVAPATRLVNAARWLKSETNWFVSDARFASWDFRRAGYTFEGMDLDRNSRDLDDHSRDLEYESNRLLAKVRP